jgi:hypothetical protein
MCVFYFDYDADDYDAILEKKMVSHLEYEISYFTFLSYILESYFLFFFLFLYPQCNRYPLHYACALPEGQDVTFVRILLEKNPEQIEKKMDKVMKMTMI